MAVPHAFSAELKEYQTKGWNVESQRPVADRLGKTISLLEQNLTAPEKKQLLAAASPFEFLLKALRLAVVHGFALESNKSAQLFNRALVRGLEASQRLRERAEPTLGTADVAKLLNVSSTTIRQNVKRRQLLALSKGSQDRVFPSFQFHEHEIVPGFSEALDALGPISPYRALSFFLDKNPELGGKPAIEVLRAGESESVIEAAHRFTSDHGT